MEWLITPSLSDDFKDYKLSLYLLIGTIQYSSDSVCVCPCLCVCVYLHYNSNRSRNMKLEYIVVYENSSDKFDMDLRWIKDKVTLGVQKFFPFTTVHGC